MGPGGQIIVSGGAGVTFYGDINQQGALTVSKVGSTTSVAVFFGMVEGNGATGGGDIFFEGGLEPGPPFAAGDVVFDNNVAFGSQATLEIELGDDAQYDHVDVTGLLTLDGTLDVELVPGFRPNLGDSFDILDWGTRNGEFDTLDLPGLLGNLKWDTSRLYSDGVLAVLAAGLPGDYQPKWRRRCRRLCGLA